MSDNASTLHGGTSNADLRAKVRRSDVLDRRCDSCGCLEPANTHGEAENITHQAYTKMDGRPTLEEMQAAAMTKVGPKSVAKVQANIAKTERLIASGQIPANRVHTPAQQLPLINALRGKR